MQTQVLIQQIQTELKGNEAELTTFKVPKEPKISFWKAHHRHYEVKHMMDVISIISRPRRVTDSSGEPPVFKKLHNMRKLQHFCCSQISRPGADLLTW